MLETGGKFSRKFAGDDGSSMPLVIGLIFAIVLALGLGGFGYWAYSQMNQYKNTADQKAAAAAQAATDATTKSVTDKLNAQFTEKYKQPFTQFTSPGMFGTVSFQYPRTWSQFVSSNQHQFSAYFYPTAVPPINDQNTAFALRVTIVPQNYSQVLQSFQGNVRNGKLSSNTLNTGVGGGAKGVILRGQFSTTINGSMAAFPVLNGNYTLQIYSDSHDFEPDFMNTVLPSLKYDL
jgi:hypothetical protein